MSYFNKPFSASNSDVSVYLASLCIRHMNFGNNFFSDFNTLIFLALYLSQSS